MKDSGSVLFAPIQVGEMALSHRIVMAPMTRLRASDHQVPSDLAKVYYRQRASLPGTLLITEATFTSLASRGRARNAPGIFNAEQVAAWKKIVDEVHRQGSFIFCQLWHIGRAARARELEELGLSCLSSSAIPMPTDNAHPLNEADEYGTPRAMTEEEIQITISDFANAAKNAVYSAGFDGVEIHAANGYLIDQFTQPACNQRTDRWGGNIENRSRFCVEVTRAVTNAIGPERTGLRLSPFSPFQGMGMEDPAPQFVDIIKQVSAMKLAYLHLVEPRINGATDRDTVDTESLGFAFEAWSKSGPLILAGGFTPDTAKKAVEEDHIGDDVLIAFGRHFVSNPDLPHRIMRGIEFSPYNRDTFYKIKSPDGYIDYEFAASNTT